MTPTDILTVIMPLFGPLYFLFIYNEARGVIHRNPDQQDDFLPGRRFSDVFLLVAIVFTTAMMIVNFSAGIAAVATRLSIIIGLFLIWLINRRFLAELVAAAKKKKE
jgi:hypothetical protein